MKNRSGLLKKAGAGLTAGALAFSLTAGGAGAVTPIFSDVAAGSWYYSYVLRAVREQLMAGMGDGVFSPDGTLTREQFITMLAALSDADLSSADGKSLAEYCTDVPDDSWAAPYIYWAYENGITSGMTADTFGLGQPVTRAQMAVFVAAYVKETGKTLQADPDAVAAFADAADIPTWAADAVEQLRAAGLFTGDSQGNFLPNSNTTRAQGAVVFCGLLDKLGTGYAATDESERTFIEETLNLSNNDSRSWTYSSSADAWVLAPVSAVAYPEIENEQGVSVCVPGAYVKGLDTDGDGTADLTGADCTSGAKGDLVIDYEAEIVSSNGQTYTAETAPVILNTGAAGYSSSTNSNAATTYAKEGYINVSCGNRGKQDTVTTDDSTYYTGDAPSCLVDQKNAARYVRYNILLGNLPGDSDRLISTGGSGGGAHAVMFASTSDNADFYDYEAECGAVGVYRNEDGTYTTSVTVNGTEQAVSDGAWGCIAYSAITSLSEADMTLAFEYYMDTEYDFNTPFQKQLAEYLSQEYMEYINAQNLTVEESAVGFDLNGDGDTADTVPLTIEYDTEAYADTNGYGGSYLTLYLKEFESNLQWYLDNLDYAEGWTWFDENGNALTDEQVASMTSADRAEAFLAGNYAKGSSGGAGGPGGTPPDGGAGGPGGTIPDGGKPDDLPDGELPSDLGGGPTGTIGNADVAANSTGDTMDVGTPDAGTTQSAGSGTDSSNYSSYDELVAAYEQDITEVEAGDLYGNNTVDLYNPLNYIGDEGTENPVWVRIMMGAAEGDISMFNSLNLQIAMLNAGIDCELEWQWDGGHVPSEIFSESFALYVDQMVAEHDGGTAVEAAAAEPQTTNGTAASATGTDLTSWVDDSDLSNVSFSLAAAAAYRVAGASKAMPGFDVMDYGQEDYVFGSMDQDARHWDSNVLKVLQEHADTLAPLFNQQ